MSARLSPKRQALAEAVTVAPGRGWQVVEGRPGRTVRWDRELPFPDHMRRWPGLRGNRPYADWGPTYVQHVFITDLGFGAPLLRVCRAPWVEVQDLSVSLARALEILADPALALDHLERRGIDDEVASAAGESR